MVTSLSSQFLTNIENKIFESQTPGTVLSKIAITAGKVTAVALAIIEMIAMGLVFLPVKLIHPNSIEKIAAYAQSCIETMQKVVGKKTEKKIPQVNDDSNTFQYRYRTLNTLLLNSLQKCISPPIDNFTTIFLKSATATTAIAFVSLITYEVRRCF